MSDSNNNAAITYKYTKKDQDIIGFASLPNQLHRKVVKKGFDFTVIVVGESGLGKSTLINSLFLQDLYEERVVLGARERVTKTTEVVAKSTNIVEQGVKLRLTIVDTPGFGDRPDGTQSWEPIVQHLEEQFQRFHEAESSVHRKKIEDTRVHCCLYFISPYGRGLKQLDIAAMKALQQLVTLVPVIGKSDTLTPKEISRLKKQVREDIRRHDIRMYKFPEYDSDEDDAELKHRADRLRDDLPFAVVGSDTVVEVGGHRVRGRLYPWGIVEVDNPSHCDFSKLRQMLISSHMQDLKDAMRDVHYENFRARYIKEHPGHDGTSQREEPAEDETERLLQEKDAELRRMQAMLSKLQTQMTSSRGAVPLAGIGDL